MDLSKRIRGWLPAGLAVLFFLAEGAWAGTTMSVSSSEYGAYTWPKESDWNPKHSVTPGFGSRTHKGTYSPVLLLPRMPGLTGEPVLSLTEESPFRKGVSYFSSAPGFHPANPAKESVLDHCAQSGLLFLHDAAVDFIPENLLRGMSGYSPGRIEERDSGKRPFRITAKWGWVGSAVALAAGITGYIMKAQADRAYDLYMDTIVPDAMDRHFEDAVRYDTISGICYAFGEVCLVFSLVVFIRTVGAE